MKQFCKISVLALTLLTLIIVSSTYAGTDKPSAASSHSQTAPKPQSKPSLLTGKVAETFDSGGYTYILLDRKGKKTWVAIPTMKTTVGQEITLMPGAEMHNFRSNTLNRNFETIIFSAGAVNQQGAINTEAGKPLTGSNASAVPKNEKIKISKAAGTNAYTVGEIYKKRDTLNNKSVLVRGKVVKVSANIMGKNWIHLQDGTGDPKNNSHELVVTSKDLPKVDDVVTASGTLYKDKDFGAGYKYAVIMEKASVKK